jgi:hypothetical protein
MLFLYRPRQTWMPYRVPRPPTQQQRYNRQLQDRFDATRRVPVPVIGAPDPRPDTVTALKELGELHASGMIDDAEFAAAKAKVLDGDSATQ